MADGVLSRRGCVIALGLPLCGCFELRRKKVAVIPKAVSHGFWRSVQQGAVAAGKEFNVDILWEGPEKETDFSEQIRIIDSMIARRVDGIALSAGERHALSAPVKRVTAAGIPITIFDSGVEAEANDYVSYVATDNIEAGRTAARRIAEVVGRNGHVGMVLHAPGSASTMDREQGFTETLEREFPQIRVVDQQYGMSDPARARAAVENMLNRHPAIQALFASSEPSSVAAAQVLKDRHLENRVFLMAFDTSDAMVADLRAGAIDAMIVQDPQRMGYEAVKTLVLKFKGKNPPKRLDLNPAMVEMKDLAEPNVKRLLNLN